MSHSPYDVISLHLKYDRLSKGSVTSLQRGELWTRFAQEIPQILWEIPVVDIWGDRDLFILKGKLLVPELKRSYRGCEVKALFRGSQYRARLLSLPPSQRVRIEGRPTCCGTEGGRWSFEVDPARLVE